MTTLAPSGPLQLQESLIRQASATMRATHRIFDLHAQCLQYHWPFAYVCHRPQMMQRGCSTSTLNTSPNFLNFSAAFLMLSATPSNAMPCTASRIRLNASPSLSNPVTGIGRRRLTSAPSTKSYTVIVRLAISSRQAPLRISARVFIITSQVTIISVSHLILHCCIEARLRVVPSIQ